MDSYDGYDYDSGKGRLRGVGATGGALAFRREAFDAVGGLLDKCILGHGDWFMTFGLVGQDAPGHALGRLHGGLPATRFWRGRKMPRAKNEFGIYRWLRDSLFPWIQSCGGRIRRGIRYSSNTNLRRPTI